MAFSQAASFSAFHSWGYITPMPAVSPAAITLPGVTGYFFGGLFRSAGYYGPSLRLQRLSDNTQADIYWDKNQMVDAAAVTAFMTAVTPLDSGVVVTLYNHLGGIDATQPAATAPYLWKNGLLCSDALGLPMMQGGTSEGNRFLNASGVFTGGVEFSVSALAVNTNKAYTSYANDGTLINPVCGLAPSVTVGSSRFGMGFGAIGATAYYLAGTELQSQAGVTEQCGEPAAIPQYSTCFMTANVLNGNLAGGPAQGTTFYFNRQNVKTSNTATQTPTAWSAVACDFRLFQRYRSSWTTETGGGCQIGYAWLGAPLTDPNRAILEGQIYEKCAAFIAQKAAYVLPGIGGTGEILDFSTYANHQVVGKKGNTVLNFTTGGNYSLGTAPIGHNGLLQNDSGVGNACSSSPSYFSANNTYAQSASQITVMVVHTPYAQGGTDVCDFIGMGTISPASPQIPDSPNTNCAWLVGKDHIAPVVWTNDASGAPNWDLMVNGNSTAGAPVYIAIPQLNKIYACPAHDNLVPSADQPFMYSMKTNNQIKHTLDGQNYPYNMGYTYVHIFKTRPNPNPAGNNYERGSDTVLKTCQFGNLMGFGNESGGWSQRMGVSSLMKAQSGMGLVSDCGHQICTYNGYRHFVVLLPGVWTTDAQDMALFYNGFNLANLI